MMNKNQQSPIWPYLAILAFLFVLSVTAPRAWERHSRQEVSRVVTRSQSIDAQFPPAPEADFPPGDEPLAEEADLEALETEIEPVAAAGPAVLSTELEMPLHADLASDALVVPPAPEFAAEVPGEAAGEVSDEAREEVRQAMPENVRRPIDVAKVPAFPSAPGPDMSPPADEIPPEPDVPGAVATSAWPLPRVLLEQLTSLVHDDPQLVWAARAIELVRELCQDEVGGQPSAQMLDSLRELVDHAEQVPPSDRSMTGEITRVRYALRRWIDVWSSAQTLRDVPVVEEVVASEPEKIRLCLSQFETLAGDDPAGAAWREYLQLQALREASQRGQSEANRREAARAVLDRLASRRLSRKQRQFIAEGPLAELAHELRAWAAEPVGPERLLAHLEQYEYSGLASDAEGVANDLRGLAWAGGDGADSLTRRLEAHYRNANVRAAVAGDLLDRLVPQPARIDAPVRDVVVNVPVRGYSSTFTELSIRLIPDERRIRLGLEARGVVESDTVASSGPATFRNAGQSTFLVRKLFVLGPHGLSVWPAIAEAENNFNYLVALETDFDGVPLVGTLVRSIARNQLDENRSVARQQTAQKVAIRALRQFDEETKARLVEVGEKIENKQVATLRRLKLELTPVSLSTTDSRIVARARLGTRQQLGAHTPRPRAPSDSWLSVQVHQSAINNALAQLDLDGRTFEIAELFEWVAEKLGRPELAQLDDLPEDARLTFARKDPVRVNCKDGRVEVTIALAELTHGGRRWHDFEVHTSYAPRADGLAPRFARDDTIHLAGESLRGKLELRLRAIFSRVLSKNRDLRLLDESITGDERLADLEVTQFVVEDGWIGLAYSPRRQASEVAEKPR